MSAVHKESRSRSITDIEGRSRSTALSQSGVVHNDDQKYRRASANLNTSDQSWLEESNRAAEEDKKRTLWQSLKLYPHAVGWSILLSTAVIMEGFDILLITNLLAVEPFRRQFGYQTADGDWVISAAWQAGLTNGALVGEIIGLMVNGWIADKIGYRKTMIGALTAVIGFVFIVFFAFNISQLLVGLILMGIPWGVFQTLTTTYAAEVCPTGLRAYLTTYVNLCWVLGQFIAQGVLLGTYRIESQWAYRIPYALQWLWPVPLIIGIFLAPESPWWLVRKGRFEDAKHSLRRLTSRSSSTFSVDDTVSFMRATNELEKATNEGTSYLDCFKGVDIRRTEVSCVTWTIQSWCGSTFMGYSTYFYQKAGLDDGWSFRFSFIQYALGAIGVFVSWYLMGHCGRRTLYFYGLCTLTTILLIIGFCSLAPQGDSGARWAIGSMLLLFTFVYDATVGPICYALVAEHPSTRLRQKTVVLARNCYNISGIVVNILTTRQLNDTAWGWAAKSGFFWGGMCGLCALWTFFRLPEPKGRTFAELDVLYENKVSARKFHKTEVDAFMSENARRESMARGMHEKGSGSE